MRIAAELRDHEAAGSLAEELPYWGWLEDGRTCLTRTGELITAGRLEPAVVDGRSPEQIDRVLGRWQRLLSGLDADTRLYFYLLRRPASPEATDDESSGIVAVSQRKRGAFLSGRVQQLEAYLVWSHDPRLRTVTDGPTSGRASRLTQWWKRRRASAPTYLGSEIEAAAARFRALVDAGRALVSEHTPIEMLEPAEASRLLSELINRPGMIWDGATGSGMNWRLALSELEAERSHLRLDGEPVILYSLLSPPGQAYANLLRDLYCLDAVMTVSLEWRPWAMEAARRRIRGAQRHYFARRYSMMAHVQETEGTAAAMVDSAAATESDRLGEALVELEADGVSYGEATLTVALHGELGRIERVDGDLRRLFDAHDAKVIREGYGQLPALKLMVVDEAWRYLQDPAVLNYLAEAAKTWRKKNAALILATQSAVDVTATPGAAALLESIPTKLFLANPELPDEVGALFRLSESELAQVRGLIPKRELYLRRPDGAAVLRLEVDPESYWLYTSSALDAEERARAVERHGLARAIEVLASRDDPTPTPNARS